MKVDQVEFTAIPAFAFFAFSDFLFFLFIYFYRCLDETESLIPFCSTPTSITFDTSFYFSNFISGLYTLIILSLLFPSSLPHFPTVQSRSDSLGRPATNRCRWHIFVQSWPVTIHRRGKCSLFPDIWETVKGDVSLLYERGGKAVLIKSAIYLTLHTHTHTHSELFFMSGHHNGLHMHPGYHTQSC